ncbi:RNA polymerase-like protein [Arabidopsis thaliana]|uniref:RNA polymerase-like protein n=1 Tax=Arabidopsis thaliana TaxID=3702 RepID=Q9LUR5_ARATH|nr:RNA polymerase-like protein [Arabidopsis thaliana]
MALMDEEIKRLFLVQRTLMQMLKDRGYLIDGSEITMTLEEFIEKYGDNMKRSLLLLSKLRKMMTMIRAILVVQDIKAFSRQALVFLGAVYPIFHIEVFQEKELIVNVKEHVFVPEHQALTTEEKQKFLERKRTRFVVLPRIHVTDPIARYFGLKRGEVVKISRLSETSGRYITYRYVI